MKINNFPNYTIDKQGNVLNLKNKLLYVGWRGSKGGSYPYVTLYNKGIRAKKSLHILVAEHYIYNNNILRTQVNHINKDRSNYNINNLEWVTPKENIHHKNNYKGIKNETN
jgi:HNH endonuclease